MATWQQTRRACDSERSRAHAWERLARASVAMAREIQAAGTATARTCLRYDVALQRLRARGEQVEGL